MTPAPGRLVHQSPESRVYPQVGGNMLPIPTRADRGALGQGREGLVNGAILSRVADMDKPLRHCGDHRQ